MSDRDEFSPETKRTLASRVGWKCSAPECRRPTVGPKLGEPSGIVILAEAAHITAAARKGPRFDEALTPEERSGLENGIWLCRRCAAVVDRDHLNYSAETLRQWRQLAEARAHQALVGEGGEIWVEPSTLVSFGPKIIAESVWLGGSREKWGFGIRHFVRGSSAELRSFVEAVDGNNIGGAFITVESQGDARLLTGVPEWELGTEQSNVIVKVTLPIQARPEREDPREMGHDIALTDGDLDPNMMLIKGMDTAKQHVWMALATPLGDFWHPEWGSRWRELAEEFQSDRALLGRLFLLDMARLVNVPVPSRQWVKRGSTVVEEEIKEAPLKFVERVESVTVLDLDLARPETRVRIKLRWAATGERWESDLRVPLHAARPVAPTPPSGVFIPTL